MKKSLVALSVSALLLLGAAHAAHAESMSLRQLVDLFISLGIIPADKAAAAKAAVGGTSKASSLDFCHTWDVDLTVGSNTDDVSWLNTVLNREGFLKNPIDGPFSENVAAAVVKFQGKHGIPQTGYVGPLTRAKLNSLYGCAGGDTGGGSPTTPSAPYISSIDPAPIPAGSTVALKGSGFNANQLVTMNGYSEDGMTGYDTNFNSSSVSSDGTSLTFTLPATIKPGTYRLNVLEIGKEESNLVIIRVTSSNSDLSVRFDETSYKVMPNEGFAIAGHASAAFGSITVAVIGPDYAGATDWDTLGVMLKGSPKVFTAVSKTVNASAGSFKAVFGGLQDEGYYTVLVYDSSNRLIGSSKLWVTFKG